MMKKRRISKKLLVMAALLLFSAFTMAVCAEDGGYWTTCTDSEGRVVRVFTYTEPVEYTFGEWDPDQPLDQPDEPVEPDDPVAGADKPPSTWRPRGRANRGSRGRRPFQSAGRRGGAGRGDAGGAGGGAVQGRLKPAGR